MGTLMISPTKPHESRQLTICLMAAFSFACLMAVGAYLAIGRQIIAEAYYHEGWPLITKMLTSALPIEHYYTRAVQILGYIFFMGNLLILSWQYPERLRRLLSKQYRPAIATILGLYVILVIRGFCIPHLLNEPITSEDYSIHFANALAGSSLFLEHGVHFGFTPFHGAGCFTPGIDEFWSSLWLLLLGRLLGAVPAFNLSIFAAFLLPTICAWRAARNFGFSRATTVIWVLFSTLLLAGYTPIRAFFVFGAYGFILSVFLCLYCLSLAHRYINKPHPGRLIWLFCAGVFSLWLHPLSGLTFPVLFVPYAVAHLPRFTRTTAIHLFLAGVLALAANLPWIVPTAVFMRQGIKDVHQLNGQTHPDRILRQLADEPSLTLAFVLVAVCFIVRRRGLWRGMDSCLAISTAILAAVTFFGTQLGLSFTEPLRYTTPLCVLMTFWLAAASTRLLSLKNPVIFIPASLFVLSLVPIPPELVCGYTSYPAVTHVLNTLQQSKGRVLLQDHPFKAPYCPTRLAAMIPWYTAREVTGTPFSDLPPRMPQFVGNRIFMQSLDSLSPDRMLAYLRLYGVRSIVTYSPLAKQVFDNLLFVKCIDSVGRFRIYGRTDGPEADVSVAATYGQMEISNACSTVTVLNYHLLPGMKVIPSTLKLGPVWRLDDPDPFIKVDNGSCRRFVIRY
jgi:hypothetical protein